MPKVFVLDTNVLLYDPQSLFAFDEHDIILPGVVLEELDKFKRERDEVGANARESLRIIDRLRQDGSLQEGVSLGPDRGRLQVLMKNVEFRFVGLEKSNDNIILGAVWNLAETLAGKAQVVLVTMDLGLRVKADALGLNVQAYRGKERLAAADVLAGVTRRLDGEDVVDGIYAGDRIGQPLPALDDMLEGDCAIVEAGKKSALVRVQNGQCRRVNPGKAAGITGRNAEQRFLLDMLLDEKVRLVVINGVAGSGKTLLSVAAGVEQVVGGRYDKVLITKAIQAVGQDIGFVKGDKVEKMMEWVKPFTDNLEMVSKGGKYGDMLLDDICEIDALTYIRGRSLMNRFVIVDEVQNLHPNIIKTIVSRISDSAKLVLLGDVQQIDNPYLDSRRNGLTYVMQRLRNLPGVGMLSMVQSERGYLAQLAVERL